ncbi:MAG: hypothetical protein P8J33_00865 [Pirellulaceae bacterium]|nr:hypothetical protein [Pirellulaceae bacterium]
MGMRSCSTSFLLFMVTLCVGCGSGEKVPPLVPVEGVVLDQEGKPMDIVSVMFLPDPEQENYGQPSIGQTDEEGKFVLFYDGDKTRPGAAVGRNRVILKDVKAIRTSRDEKPMLRRFHKKYVTASTTDLSFDVNPGEGQSFEIKVDNSNNK